MNNVSQFVQKYRQASWRVQLQWLVLFMAGLVVIAMVAGLYLSVSIRATQAGREIQALKKDILIGQRMNADLALNLARLTSSQAMKSRALALGFKPLEPEQITYVAVAGYTPPTAINLARLKTPQLAPIILPEYSLSLFEWFADMLQSTPPTSSWQP
ncbi:MAG: hypothetical protein QMD04_02045 [Anaerolineales bacterium]|nr:hypothetical protein [Anaerolineales bacterium]